MRKNDIWIEQLLIGKTPVFGSFSRFFEVKKSEFFRLSLVTFLLFLCCYCSIYILSIKGQQQQNRTNFNTYFNSSVFSEKFRSVLQEQTTKAPATRRHPADSVKGARIRTSLCGARARRQVSGTLRNRMQGHAVETPAQRRLHAAFGKGAVPRLRLVAPSSPILAVYGGC